MLLLIIRIRSSSSLPLVNHCKRWKMGDSPRVYYTVVSFFPYPRARPLAMLTSIFLLWQICILKFFLQKRVQKYFEIQSIYKVHFVESISLSFLIKWPPWIIINKFLKPIKVSLYVSIRKSVWTLNCNISKRNL